jgi:hypothetical protein
VSFIPGLSFGEKIDGLIMKSAHIKTLHISPEMPIRNLYFIFILLLKGFQNLWILFLLAMDRVKRTFCGLPVLISVIGIICRM